MHSNREVYFPDIVGLEHSRYEVRDFLQRGYSPEIVREEPDRYKAGDCIQRERFRIFVRSVCIFQHYLFRR
jgi:hypothetical protein